MGQLSTPARRLVELLEFQNRDLRSELAQFNPGGARGHARELEIDDPEPRLAIRLPSRAAALGVEKARKVRPNKSQQSKSPD